MKTVQQMLILTFITAWNGKEAHRSIGFSPAPPEYLGFVLGPFMGRMAVAYSMKGQLVRSKPSFKSKITRLSIEQVLQRRLC